MNYKQQVMKVLLHIQQHLDEELTVEELAGVAGFSAYHFHRIFRALTGESLMTHVRRLRMERAAWRLMSGQATVVNIALECGYQTAEAFSRRFRKSYGLSPQQFRERHGLSWQLTATNEVHYHPETPPILLDSLYGEELAIETVHLPPQKVVTLPHRGPYLKAVNVWPELLQWGSGRKVGVCYDDPAVVPAAELRYDACLPYQDGEELGPGMTVKTLWGGLAAVYVHHGSYEGLEKAYEDLAGNWLVRSGMVARDKPCLEVYEVSAFDGRPEEEWETLIYLPLQE